jgi:membrane associated rhomboid family serine protease
MAFSSNVEKSPLRVLGVVPADVRLPSLLTYQFAHLGWGHLLGNLFILFLAGPFVEDRWGRPLYAAFYLSAGVVAALMFVARYHGLNLPLVGASGAIAGVMGAFLILFWNTKIRFLYWFFFFMVGTFEAPAWLMLPLWFLKELFFAQAMDAVAPGEGGGGVAFWAHVWGFVFGVAVASAIAYFRVEERFIHRAIESKITVVDNTGVEAAAALAEEGDREGAIASLENELKARPDNVDAAIALWNICFRDGRVAAAVPHMLRAIRRAARTGDHQFVTTHWLELLDSGHELEIEPALGTRVAEILRDGSHLDAAMATVDLTARRVDESTPAGVLLRIARLALVLDSPHAARLAAAALANTELPSEAREELESVAGSATAAETVGCTCDDADSAAPDDEAEDEPITHTVHAKKVIPRRVEGSSLEVEVDGRRHSVDLATIQVLAACGIARAAQKPVVLVDLLLDSPWGDRPRLRVIRMTSDTFDPRTIVGGDDALKSFRRLLDRLFELSGAVPLPDPESARGNPFRSFSTVDAYEKEVLGIKA